MKKYFYLLFAVIILLSCSEDESSANLLNEINVTSISNENLNYARTDINSLAQSIYIFFDDDLTNVSFPLIIETSIKISKGAKTTLSNDQLVFNSSDQVIEFDIIAENGNTTTWLVFLVHKQLQNSDFDIWHDAQGLNGIYYDELGTNVPSSIWATANLGTSTYSVYGSKPITIVNNTLIQIKTDSVKQLPITAGTAFTGYFYLNGAISNPGDPKKATLFGTPFIHKPSAFKVKYKYTAGTYYKQAELVNPDNIFGGFTEESISGEDKCAIYAILETRDNDAVVEIARAELFSTSTSDVITETIIPFEYLHQLEPTHITVVFSSSKDGDLWRGAVGSTLVIDELELVYD